MWTLFVNACSDIISSKTNHTYWSNLLFQINNHHYLLGRDQWCSLHLASHTSTTPLLVQNTWRYLIVHLFCLLGKVVKASLQHTGQALVTICEACFASSKQRLQNVWPQHMLRCSSLLRWWQILHTDLSHGVSTATNEVISAPAIAGCGYMTRQPALTRSLEFNKTLVDLSTPSTGIYIYIICYN